MSGFFGAESAGYWPWAYIMAMVTVAVAFGVRMYCNHMEREQGQINYSEVKIQGPRCGCILVSDIVCMVT